jgi:glucuronate isomerase
MSKSLRQRIFEDTGYDMLSPISIARDHRLRVLYEAYIEAKDATGKEAAYEAFAKFVREEYQ